METVYLGCAILGGTLLVCQFVMTLLGLGGDHDISHDAGHDHGHDHSHEHSSSWFVGLLTFRTIVAALAFFGVGGKFGSEYGLQPLVTLGVAAVAGFAAMYLVGEMMKWLHKLKSEGNVRIERAIGATGTVYLTIPASKSGVGKVTLSMQNRTVELHAVTNQEHELPTGTKIVAVAVVGPGTVEVAVASSMERVNDV